MQMMIVVLGSQQFACILLKTYVAFFTHATEVGEFITYSLYLCRVIVKL